RPRLRGTDPSVEGASALAHLLRHLGSRAVPVGVPASARNSLLATPDAGVVPTPGCARGRVSLRSAVRAAVLRDSHSRNPVHAHVVPRLRRGPRGAGGHVGLGLAPELFSLASVSSGVPCHNDLALPSPAGGPPRRSAPPRPDPMASARRTRARTALATAIYRVERVVAFAGGVARPPRGGDSLRERASPPWR